MKYRLTYDFGSGSVKASLTDETFSPCGAENEPYTTYFPHLGWAEQKPQEQWEAMCRATRHLLRSSGVRPADIEGIAIAQTATTIIFVDAQGQPLTDCVMWMDGRAEEQAKALNKRLGGAQYHGKNIISKLLWFMEHKPEIVEKAAYMLDVSAYLFHRMTGQWAYEFTGSRATGLVDIPRRCWDEAMFEKVGFPRRLVPQRIVASSEQVGVLQQAAATQLGLVPGIALFGGCSDHATATLGTGCLRPGDAHIYIGTSAWLAVSTSADDPNPGRMPSPVENMRYHFYDTDSGGSCMDYLLKTYYAKEVATGEDVYAQMNQEIHQAIAEGDHENVLFLPFLAGASAPIANTTVRATLLNLTHSTKRRHIARGVVEGICFNLRWMRDIHKETNGWNPNFLRGIGGGMLNAVLMQTLADVLDTPIVPLENPRFAGNLGLQACIEIGLGRAKDFMVLDQVVKCARPYLPQPQLRPRYDRLYAIYRQSYESLTEIYQQLNQEHIEGE